MKTFETTVRTRGGPTKVRLQANSVLDAKLASEAQYGKNNVMFTPTEVKETNSSYNSAPWMKTF